MQINGNYFPVQFDLPGSDNGGVDAGPFMPMMKAAPSEEQAVTMPKGTKKSASWVNKRKWQQTMKLRGFS